MCQEKHRFAPNLKPNRSYGALIVDTCYILQQKPLKHCNHDYHTSVRFVRNDATCLFCVGHHVNVHSNTMVSFIKVDVETFFFHSVRSFDAW
jgi:hypothetical protein